MLTKLELNFLGRMKRFNGMSEEQIEQELINLLGSQNNFKTLKKQLDLLTKKNKRYELEIEKLKDTINKKNKEIFLIKHKGNIEVKEKETNGSRTANVYQVKRIMCFLDEEQKLCSKNKIAKSCGMLNGQIDSALNFLVNHNLITKEIGGYKK